MFRRSLFDRLIELLRCYKVYHEHEALEAEAADFFGNTHSDRAETEAFEKAALRTLVSDRPAIS